FCVLFISDHGQPALLILVSSVVIKNLYWSTTNVNFEFLDVIFLPAVCVRFFLDSLHLRQRAGVPKNVRRDHSHLAESCNAHSDHAAAAAANVPSESQISQSHKRDLQSGFICCPVSVMVSLFCLHGSHRSTQSLVFVCYMRLSLIRVLWVHHASGIWVYPIMAHLSPVGLCVFFGGASLSMAPLYLLGEKLSLMMWSSTGEKPDQMGSRYNYFF
uniref:Androgen dependent TFPI regulating protein 1 n=1 Tax=Cyprinus carpio TaxID=7962 RepID=A0A8C2FGL6_CYPCA